LLHGGFDFCLELLSIFGASSHTFDYDDVVVDIETLTEDVFSIPALLLGMLVMALGSAYYVHEARKQRERLIAFEQARRGLQHSAYDGTGQSIAENQAP
jgi:hypothetical protein